MVDVLAAAAREPSPLCVCVCVCVCMWVCVCVCLSVYASRRLETWRTAAAPAPPKQCCPILWLPSRFARGAGTLFGALATAVEAKCVAECIFERA